MLYFWTSDWEQRKLGDLADSIEYGLNASATIYDGENIYIRITDIDESSHLFLRKNITSPDTDLSNANNYLLETGDLLFARTGASVGKTYQYNISDGKVYFAGFLIRARIKKEFNSNFIFQNTLTSNYQNFIIITSQRSGQPGVNAQEYATFQLAIPSREEQDQLGTFFEQIDKTIALHQRKLVLIKRLKQTYLDALFPQNDGNIPALRFADFSEPWKQRKLGDLSESLNYGLNASATEFDGENKYIRITDIDDDNHRFMQDGLTTPNANLSNADDYLLREGDILFARTGASVGKTYKYDRMDGKVYYAGFLIRARIKSEFDTNFIFQSTLTEKYKNFIKITSQRSGQPGVNAQEYASFSIMVPDREEQDTIGNFFKKIDDNIVLHQRKIGNMKALKNVLLNRMFI